MAIPRENLKGARVCFLRRIRLTEIVALLTEAYPRKESEIRIRIKIKIKIKIKITRVSLLVGLYRVCRVTILAIYRTRIVTQRERERETLTLALL